MQFTGRDDSSVFLWADQECFPKGDVHDNSVFSPCGVHYREEPCVNNQVDTHCHPGRAAKPMLRRLAPMDSATVGNGNTVCLVILFEN